MSSVGTTEACHQAGVRFRQVDYWDRQGAITPTAKASGSGSRRLWNRQDVAMLAAIGRVRRDLDRFGLDISVDLVDELWRELGAHGQVVLTYGSVSISVGLEAV